MLQALHRPLHIPRRLDNLKRNVQNRSIRPQLLYRRNAIRIRCNEAHLFPGPKNLIRCQFGDRRRLSDTRWPDNVYYFSPFLNPLADPLLKKGFNTRSHGGR
ncbi:hypothetical protein D3C77_579270 [compost metagenome]